MREFTIALFGFRVITLVHNTLKIWVEHFVKHFSSLLCVPTLKLMIYPSAKEQEKKMSSLQVALVMKVHCQLFNSSIVGQLIVI